MLSFVTSSCVIIENSPLGIKAGVAGGATVIAVCAGHQRHQIEHCATYFIVDDLNQLNCEFVNDVLELTVDTLIYLSVPLDFHEKM
jgi:beta-phosphoglucomutase-like phosphatase (HAD superfamily)